METTTSGMPSSSLSVDTPHPAPHPAPEPARSLWRNGDYLRLMSGQTLSAIGSAMSGFAFLLLGYALTGSTALAGGVAAASMAGSVVCALPAGALVDRWPRKRVMVCCTSGGAVLYGSVVLAHELGHLTAAHLVVVAALSAGLAAFFGPAEVASLRQIVPAADLPTAMSVNQGRQGLASLIGAPVAGALFALGRVIPIVADAASYLVCAWCVGTMKAPLAAPERAGEREPVVAAIRAGLRWVWDRRDLRMVAVLSTVVNFAANGFLTGLVLVLQRRGEQPAVIGLLETGLAAGLLVGAVLAPGLLRRFRTGMLVIAGFWVVALALSGMAFASSIVVYIAGLAVVALLLPALNSGLMSYEALVTPDAMQGRVTTAVTFLAMGLAPLAPVLSGVLLERWSATPTLLVFGGLLLVAAALAGGSGALRSIPRLADVPPAA
ncbi:MAG TPA: MFS transporter [Segeticoccus sp.]|uniref:MFS transporter n=1 Tax=Segeticoccus sp. TaxID=2706531 RepID=UPI002D7F6FC9|nr:MFS transporter [Segeticoccus sp.]HET8600889.1 MFS transporter [Segeticoccus sp.]